jgi:hypothetical protein
MITLSLDKGPGKKRQNREMSSTVYQENDLFGFFCFFRFFVIMATMRLHNIDVRKWSVDRGPEPINP